MSSPHYPPKPNRRGFIHWRTAQRFNGESAVSLTVCGRFITTNATRGDDDDTDAVNCHECVSRLAAATWQAMSEGFMVKP